MHTTIVPKPEWINSLLPRLRLMPARPETHQQVLKALGDPEADNDDIAKLINKDVALTGHVLKMGNSAVFASPQKIGRTADAVSLIGTMRLKALVNTAWAFQLIDGKTNIPNFDPKAECDHALQVGAEALKLAHEYRCGAEMAEEAFTAAVLHDLGKILMAINTPELYTAVSDEMEVLSVPRWEAEKSLLGFDHASLGGYMVETWGMTYRIVSAVKFHHEPQSQDLKEISPTVLVHVANCNVRGIEPHPGCKNRLLITKSKSVPNIG